jgi:hypothetical protein
MGVTGTDLFGLRAPRTAAMNEPEALVNAAKFAATRCQIPGLVDQLNDINNYLKLKRYL